MHFLGEAYRRHDMIKKNLAIYGGNVVAVVCLRRGLSRSHIGCINEEITNAENGTRLPSIVFTKSYHWKLFMLNLTGSVT